MDAQNLRNAGKAHEASVKREAEKAAPSTFDRLGDRLKAETEVMKRCVRERGVGGPTTRARRLGCCARRVGPRRRRDGLGHGVVATGWATASSPERPE